MIYCLLQQAYFYIAFESGVGKLGRAWQVTACCVIKIRTVVISLCSFLMSQSNKKKSERSQCGCCQWRKWREEDCLISFRKRDHKVPFFSTPNYTCSSRSTSPIMFTKRHKDLQINRRTAVRPRLF